jgi:hypothetical protein
MSVQVPPHVIKELEEAKAADPSSIPKVEVEIGGVSYIAMLPADFERAIRENKRTIRRLKFQIAWVQLLTLVNRVCTPDSLIALLVAAALVVYWMILYRLHGIR